MPYEPFPYETRTRNAGLKKWVSAVAAADYGDSQALWVRPGFPTLNACEIGGARLMNRSGGACLVGLGGRYSNTLWQAGQVTATGVYTDDTLGAQDSLTNDFPVYQPTLADGNGFLVGATERFNLLSLVLSTAGDQTAPVTALQYWNGSAWTTLTGALLVNDALTSPTGEKLLLFSYPSDWMLGGSGTGVPPQLYNVRVLSTVSGQGVTSPLARQLFVGHAILVADPVADGGQGSLSMPVSVRFPKTCAALAPIFSVAAPANFCEVQLRTYG